MNPNTVGLLHDTKGAAQSLGIQVQVLEVRNGAEVDTAFESAVKGGLRRSSRFRTLCLRFSGR